MVMTRMRDASSMEPVKPLCQILIIVASTGAMQERTVSYLSVFTSFSMVMMVEL